MGSIDLSYQMFNYRDLDILMVGPKGKGGISILQENLISELSSKFQIQRFISTGNYDKPTKFILFTLITMFFPFFLIFFRPKIVHIHFASRGSFWRKFTLTLLSKIYGSKVVLHAHGGKFMEFYEIYRFSPYSPCLGSLGCCYISIR